MKKKQLLFDYKFKLRAHCSSITKPFAYEKEKRHVKGSGVYATVYDASSGIPDAIHRNAEGAIKHSKRNKHKEVKHIVIDSIGCGYKVMEVNGQLKLVRFFLPVEHNAWRSKRTDIKKQDSFKKNKQFHIR